MKKNAMLKIAAILLVAVLLSTCAISATFAKYVTRAGLEEAATARVAKWGITATVTGDEAFATEYGTVVRSSTTDKVLAPGTKNLSAIVVSIDCSKAEVDFEVSGEFTVELGDKWNDADGFYCPVKFIIGDDTITSDGYDSADAYETAIKTAIENALTITGDSNDTSKTVTIGWQWDAGEASDSDTALGNAAADGAAPTISIDGDIVITQKATNHAEAV